MKILFCTNSFKNVTNGPAKFANYLLDINTLLPGNQIKILTEDVDQTSDEIFKLHIQIPLYLKPLGQFVRMYKYYQNARFIKENYFEYDVIVFNNAIIGLWAGINDSCTIGMINDDNNACTNFSDALKSKRGFKQWIFRILEKRSCSYHTRIITNSDYLTTKLQKEYSVKNLRKLYKSTATPVAVKKSNDLNAIETRILFVKNDYVRGGLFVLIDAVSQLASRRLKVIVIGPSKENGRSITEYAASRGVDCQFMGPQSQTKVFEEMLLADIFCVPAYQEALGVANIEALSRRLPVITTNVGGIPEVLDNGRNGWMVNPGNSSELAKAITECLDNTELRNEKISNGFEFAKKFEKNNMLQSFVDIVNEAKVANKK